MRCPICAMDFARTETESADERALVERARRGDLPAYDALVRRYEALAFRAAYLITRDEHEAADAAQDAFVRAYRALSSFRAGEPFRPWLLRIVTNQALNRLQARQRREKMTERYARMIVETETKVSPQQSVELRDRSERLLKAVARLKPEEQTLVALRYFLELPEAEVAQALGIAQGTVKSRTHRTLARLREIIRAEFPDLADLAPEQGSETAGGMP